MSDSDSPASPVLFDPQLLDARLRPSAEGLPAALSARLRSDEHLATQDRELSALLAALGRYTTPAVPADLEARVNARIASAGPALRVGDAQRDDHEAPLLLRMSSMREILAVAAMIVLAVGLGVPSLVHVRERNQRVACSWNQAQLGRGLATYASTFRGELPFVGWSGASSWRVSSEPNVESLPNRRHLYPLLSGQIASPVWFVCPAVPGTPMPADQIRQHNDFLESANVAYAYQNQAGVRPTTRGLPELPILADDNPLFENGLPLLDLARRIGLHDPASANSRAHGGAGQNMLTLGGNVKWVSTPLSGIGGDNIWTLSHVTTYSGREGPLAGTDSHLLK